MIEPFEFHAEDPDALCEVLQGLAPGAQIHAFGREEFCGEIRAWDFPHMNIFSLSLGGATAALPESRDFFGLTVPLRGVLEACDGGRTRAIDLQSAHFVDRNEAVVYRPRRRSQVIAGNVDVSLVAQSGQRELRPQEGGSRLVRDTEAEYSWATLLKWIFQEVQRGESALSEDRTAVEVEGALAALVFSQIAPVEAQGVRPSEAVLRRAEEILDARVEGGISLPRLAEEVGCSVRTLTRQFHARHGVGPMGFLRQRRLAAARCALRRADPTSTTVTEVAVRYGFYHTGRFAGVYRAAFGESPSETLRR